jgi:hypothetical protein
MTYFTSAGEFFATPGEFKSAANPRRKRHTVAQFKGLRLASMQLKHKCFLPFLQDG